MDSASSSVAANASGVPMSGSGVPFADRHADRRAGQVPPRVGSHEALRGEGVQARPRHDQHVEALPPRQPDRDRVGRAAGRRPVRRHQPDAGIGLEPRCEPIVGRGQTARRHHGDLRRALPPGPPAVRSRTGMRRPRASARGRAAAPARPSGRVGSLRAQDRLAAPILQRGLPVSCRLCMLLDLDVLDVLRAGSARRPVVHVPAGRVRWRSPPGRRHSGRRNAIRPGTSPPTVSAMCCAPSSR